MLRLLPGPVIGGLSFLLCLLNTVFWSTPLYLTAILKLLIPLPGWRKICEKILNRCASNWVYFNNLNILLTKNINWDVSGLEGLKLNEWYLVLSNHQSWVDIVVLQKVFYNKIPFLKFFIKKEMIWMPILGLAWWALDFPFMKRYSEGFLKKHPHLRGKDIEITRKACEKFSTIPVSIMNFVEGTRFEIEKHQSQKSPFTHLLKPKAGGISFVLSTMGEQLKTIVNVTIVYPQGEKGFWPFLCGKITEIKVRVETLPIKKELIGDYSRDDEFRDRFQNRVNTLWSDKDEFIGKLLSDQRN